MHDTKTELRQHGATDEAAAPLVNDTRVDQAHLPNRADTADAAEPGLPVVALDIEAGQESFIVLPVNYRIRVIRLKSEDPAAPATSIQFRQPIPTRLVIHFDGTSIGMTR